MRRTALGVTAIVAMGAQLLVPGRIDAAIKTTFSNTNPISLGTGHAFNYGPANPYPSAIEVSGLSKKVTKVTLTLHNVSHANPESFQAVVEGPTGTAVMFKQGEGGDFPVSDVTVTFDDTSGQVLRPGDTLTSGSFHTDRGRECLNSDGAFHNPDPPAPQCPYKLEFSAFKDKNPNGTWKLWMWNDFQTGSIAGGWSLNITTKGSGGGDCRYVTRAEAADCPPTYWTVAFTLTQDGIQTKPSPDDDPALENLVDTQTTASGTVRFNKKPKMNETTPFSLADPILVTQYDFHLTPTFDYFQTDTVYELHGRGELDRAKNKSVMDFTAEIVGHSGYNTDEDCFGRGAFAIADAATDKLRVNRSRCYLNRLFSNGTGGNELVDVTIGAPEPHFD